MVASSSTQPGPPIRIDREQRQVMSVQQRLSDDVSLILVQIPEGDFMMGSPDDELDRSDAEGPQHRVHVPSFWMGQYPITQEEWRVVADDFSKVNQDLDPEPSYFKGNRHPVEQVSWYDAVEFCDRLSAQTDFTYRLPSEAEWEYACRAGTSTPFYFGKTITTDLANYRGTDNEDYGWSGSYGDGPKGKYRETTTPVNQFEDSNQFGLCDMHGNVWEWCLDHWHDNYDNAPANGSTWIKGGNSDRRLTRGGSWSDYPRSCRSGSRRRLSPGDQIGNLGFRVILGPR